MYIAYTLRLKASQTPNWVDSVFSCQLFSFMPCDFIFQKGSFTEPRQKPRRELEMQGVETVSIVNCTQNIMWSDTGRENANHGSLSNQIPYKSANVILNILFILY